MAKNRVLKLIKNISGQRFGHWEVLCLGPKNGRRTLWECLCHNCGSKKLVDGNNIKAGKSKHCGCVTLSKHKNPSWTGYKEIPGKFLSRAKNGAKYRNIQFNINIEDIWNTYIKQDRKCILTGLEISFDNNTASLDRVNSKKGYYVGNIQLVHKDVNIMKNHYSEERFIEICTLVSINYKGR